MARKTINVGGELIEIPDINKNLVIGIALAILALIFVISGFYKVDASEVGVIQRFGKYCVFKGNDHKFFVTFENTDFSQGF